MCGGRSSTSLGTPARSRLASGPAIRLGIGDAQLSCYDAARAPLRCCGRMLAPRSTAVGGQKPARGKIVARLHRCRQVRLGASGRRGGWLSAVAVGLTAMLPRPGWGAAEAGGSAARPRRSFAPADAAGSASRCRADVPVLRRRRTRSPSTSTAGATWTALLRPGRRRGPWPAARRKRRRDKPDRAAGSATPGLPRERHPSPG